jgi:hypothetical protein
MIFTKIPEDKPQKNFMLYTLIENVVHYKAKKERGKGRKNTMCNM